MGCDLRRGNGRQPGPYERADDRGAGLGCSPLLGCRRQARWRTLPGAVGAPKPVPARYVARRRWLSTAPGPAWTRFYDFSGLPVNRKWCTKCTPSQEHAGRLTNGACRRAAERLQRVTPGRRRSLVDQRTMAALAPIHVVTYAGERFVGHKATGCRAKRSEASRDPEGRDPSLCSGRPMRALLSESGWNGTSTWRALAGQRPGFALKVG